MRPERILILGGTRAARNLAALLVEQGFTVTTSLAGVTENPILPPGEVRRGGFGGAEGLSRYLEEEGVAAVADATHPFAVQMSVNAEKACRSKGIPLLRLERPSWVAGPGDQWIPAASVAEAAALLPSGARALVTIGRKDVAPFLSRRDVSGVLRMIEPPGVDLPPHWKLLQDRPPFSLGSELKLMQDHGISCLVTKNAGGPETRAKIDAARELAIPVIMVGRVPKPEGRVFAEADHLAAELRRLLSP